MRLQWPRKGRGGPISRDEDHDQDLHRWLRSRLAGQTGDRTDPGAEAERGASAPGRLGFGFLAPPDADDEPETVVDRALAARMGRVTRLGPVRDEDVADRETVMAGRLAAALDLEGTGDPATARAPDHPSFRAASGQAPGAGEAWDPETVQLSRLPLSFIGEAVADPATLFDPRPEAARWREEAGRVDELPPGPLPAAVHDRSAPTLARGERPPPELPYDDEDSGFDLRTAVLIPILGGAVLGVLFVLLILAFVAGWLAM